MVQWILPFWHWQRLQFSSHLLPSAVTCPLAMQVLPMTVNDTNRRLWHGKKEVVWSFWVKNCAAQSQILMRFFFWQLNRVKLLLWKLRVLEVRVLVFFSRRIYGLLREQVRLVVMQFTQAYMTLTFLTLWSWSSRWAKAAVTIDFIYAGWAKWTGRRLTLVYIWKNKENLLEIRLWMSLKHSSSMDSNRYSLVSQEKYWNIVTNI